LTGSIQERVKDGPAAPLGWRARFFASVSNGNVNFIGNFNGNFNGWVWACPSAALRAGLRAE
jgi:hypothetical protein